MFLLSAHMLDARGMTHQCPNEAKRPNYWTNLLSFNKRIYKIRNATWVEINESNTNTRCVCIWLAMSSHNFSGELLAYCELLACALSVICWIYKFEELNKNTFLKNFLSAPVTVLANGNHLLADSTVRSYRSNSAFIFILSLLFFSWGQDTPLPVWPW